MAAARPVNFSVESSFFFFCSERLLRVDNQGYDIALGVPGCALRLQFFEIQCLYYSRDWTMKEKTGEKSFILPKTFK